MRTLCPTLLLIAAAGLLHAQTPQWQSAVAAGGRGSDGADRMAVSASGTTYSTGSFADSATFGSLTVRGRDRADLFIAANSGAGWEWARTIRSTGDDITGDIGVDAAGAIYLTATMGSDSIYLNTGARDTMIVTSSETSLLVCKYSSSGDLLWFRMAPIGLGAHTPSMAVHASGKVVVTGSFTDTLTFGERSVTSAGGHDIFVAELAPDGAVVRLLSAGGEGDDKGSDVAFDAAGSFYLTGTIFSGIARFGETEVTVSNGPSNLFLAKYGASSEPVFVKQDGASPFNLNPSMRIAVDRSGNCYMVGWFFVSITIGGRQMMTRGEIDGFVQKYNADGEFQWSDQIGGVLIDMPSDVAIDRDGNVYVAGFSQSLPAGQIFVSKYTPTGSRGWIVTDAETGSMGTVRINGMAIAENGSLHVCGSFSGKIAFGAETLTSIGSSPTSSEGSDLFLARLGRVAGVESVRDGIASGLEIDPLITSAEGIAITCRVPGPAPVDMRLYDARGAEVMALGMKPAAHGERRALLDRASLPSGAYYIVVRSNGAIVSRPLVIAR